jgi:hypothetical protein
MSFDTTLWVVCGNIAEFEKYVNLKCKSTSEIISRYRYLFFTPNLYGLTEVHGVFYGSWRQREDIDDIISQISIINKTKPNLDLRLPSYQDSRIGSLGFIATDSGIIEGTYR